ncbi:MAG: YfhO family protein [Pirellulaceae bacterium]|nr:YfhO family protein [Pirellulaceae bacterium]
MTVEVTLQRPGYLVLTDTWYPGWTAEDNGQPAALVSANLVCRAVPLGPGHHVVVFRYGWSGYLGGMILSALALVFAIRVMIRQKRISKTA